ncbi:MAG: penicillin acylase family protein [Saprospiraceae bacterium]
MPKLKFLIVVGLSLGLMFFCNSHHPFELSFPPLGKLFSPFDGFWQNANANPTGHKDLKLTGLSGPVEVVFDERMVPHIFGQNKADVFFAQGYITAMDRLWQMDIAVRATCGMLAEVMGPSLLDRDRLQRKKGLLFAAENALAAFKDSELDMEIGEAYTAGVNAYIAQLSPRDYPIEFKLLNYKPTPWSPLKSAIFFKSMAESLCARHQDLEASNALAFWGQETFDFLYPDENPKQSPIIPKTVEWAFEPIPIANMDTIEKALTSTTYRQKEFPQPPPFLGSNNWAVAGDKTANGKPILCNDPHLQLTLPSIWYEIQLHAPEFNAYGVSLPGTPGVIIGFNEHIAWGETNVGHDVLDWYKIDWVDQKKNSYYVDGAVKEIDMRYDTIWIRGQSMPHIEPIKMTVWGPVVYEADGEAYQDLAMRWIAHDKPNKRDFYEIGTFYHLMTADDTESYLNALEGYDSPAQNFVFASNNGDIAIQVNGKFPLKKKGQGRFVQEGNSSKNAWAGYIPRTQVPKVINPARGFVASANQHSAGPSYPYYYNGGFDDYRGRFINEQLTDLENIEVRDMKALQLNNFSLKAKEALPLLLAAIDTFEFSAPGMALLQALKAWDYRYEAAAKAPVLFEEWFAAFYKLTFDELDATAKEMDILYPESWRLIALLEEAPKHVFFDLKATTDLEDAAAIAKKAFEEVIDAYAAQFASADFDWGNTKATTITHLGRIDAFNSDLIYCGGSADAPNAIKKGHGPSWRMIVVLGEEVEAYGVFPGGQSGNPGSAFYDNTIQTWATGDYYPLFLMKEPKDQRVKPLLTMNLQ